MTTTQSTLQSTFIHKKGPLVHLARGLFLFFSLVSEQNFEIKKFVHIQSLHSTVSRKILTSTLKIVISSNCLFFNQINFFGQSYICREINSHLTCHRWKNVSRLPHPRKNYFTNFFARVRQQIDSL